MNSCVHNKRFILAVLCILFVVRLFSIHLHVSNENDHHTDHQHNHIHVEYFSLSDDGSTSNIHMASEESDIELPGLFKKQNDLYDLYLAFTLFLTLACVSGFIIHIKPKNQVYFKATCCTLPDTRAPPFQ